MCETHQSLTNRSEWVRDVRGELGGRSGHNGRFVGGPRGAQ